MRNKYEKKNHVNVKVNLNQICFAILSYFYVTSIIIIESENLSLKKRDLSTLICFSSCCCQYQPKLIRSIGGWREERDNIWQYERERLLTRKFILFLYLIHTYCRCVDRHTYEKGAIHLRNLNSCLISIMEKKCFLANLLNCAFFSCLYDKCIKSVNLSIHMSSVESERCKSISRSSL